MARDANGHEIPEAKEKPDPISGGMVALLMLGIVALGVAVFVEAHFVMGTGIVLLGVAGTVGGIDTIRARPLLPGSIRPAIGFVGCLVLFSITFFDFGSATNAGAIFARIVWAAMFVVIGAWYGYLLWFD